MKIYSFERLLLAALFATLACGKVTKKDISTNQPSSNVATSEPTPGVAQGHFSKDASSDQTLVGSANGAVKEDVLTVPPGALAVDTDITIREGGDLGSTPPAELGLSNVAILGGSTPVLLGASPATPKTAAPFTISIPVPLDTPSSTGLHLANGATKVGILYLIKTDSGNKVGFYPLDSGDLLGTYVRYKSSSFGWFRIVVLSTANAAIDKATSSEPPSK